MSTRETASERKAFKDYFDREAARALAAQVAAAWPRFDEQGFVRRATRGLGKLEFAGRVQQLSDALAATLPESVPEALGVLVASLPEPLPDCEAVTDGYLQWPVGQFIADHGLLHLDASFDAMVELTQRFSAEFAIRPFVAERPDETFAWLETLTGHPSPHVRRLCSEGTRTRLPWGRRLRALAADPTPVWPILEALKDDPERYVQRSVANHLNDVAKDHPALVVKRCRAWSKGAGEGRQWIVRHALRSLVKAGDPDALALIGFGRPLRLEATLRARPGRIAVGESVRLEARLETRATRAQDLMLDYVVHYVRKGDRSSEKVFKWKQVRLPARSTLELEKLHSMRATTVRALYPGLHRVELQANGERIAETRFRLE